MLQAILAKTPAAGVFPDLLVGTETGDDAAVWRLIDRQAVVSTTDFFMPVVDDPFDAGHRRDQRLVGHLCDGRQADLRPRPGRHARGQAVAGDHRQDPVRRRIRSAPRRACRSRGGHSIDSVRPIYGLVALGVVDPDKVLKNSTGRAGGVLILTKALGVGVLGAAFKQEKLDKAGYVALIASTTKLNSVGAELPDTPGVHAVTDVTGFGLLGHALEMCWGSGLAAEFDADGAALLEGVEALARAGVRTGASGRNWASYGASVHAEGLEDWRRDLLCDPQTSGGLLIAVDPSEADAVLALVKARGFDGVRIVGRMVDGEPEIQVI